MIEVKKGASNGLHPISVFNWFRADESSKIAVMSKSEILAELPKLKAEERQQVFERLCELQEEDLLQGIGATSRERKLLDEALAEFHRDGNPGKPWREVLAEVRNSGEQ
jgi:hypothetical protein